MDDNIATEIRTDLWLTMTNDQLGQQRDLILSKLSLLSQTTQTTTIIDLNLALRHALDSINGLIESSTTNPQNNSTTTL